eukprot:Colp12_sorted_trinity150504_noHs@7001
MAQRLRVLEFYSGIGAMHHALKEAEVPADVLACFDINTSANSVYSYNFSKTKKARVEQRNIQNLTLEDYEKLNVDAYLMSPPCQPFTRQGLQRGSEDARSESFLYMINIIDQLQTKPNYIFVENVKGFEVSDTRETLVTCLSKHGYSFQEFLLSPLQFDVPNSRLRYYMLAKRAPLSFPVSVEQGVIDYIPLHSMTKRKDEIHAAANEQSKSTHCDAYGQASRTLAEFLEVLSEEEESKHLVPLGLLCEKGEVADIVKPTDGRTCCFTKGYGHFIKGTGSLLQLADDDTRTTFLDHRPDCGTHDNTNCPLRKLRIRYFTPREIARLHCFPDTMGFPPGMTSQQCYRLLGNSMNVHVVAELFKYLFADVLHKNT